jgi:purine-nucleoside/S-methyl-5'-thioadenosine phosphorylase / adenosine deaminase
MEWRERDGVRWLEADLGGGRAAFTTRAGGVSEAPFDSLNLGLLTDDASEAVAENRRRLAAALSFPPERIVFARQVHGAKLIAHPRPSPSTPLRCSLSIFDREKEQRKVEVPEADGHVVAAPGVAALVFVADCLPVALSGPGGVAMLHCGWRGLAAGIVAAGAEAVGATDAAIGPGIGPCCYEVGEEVLAAFAGLGEGIAAADRAEGPNGDDISARRRLDLPEVARRLLAEAGVERVESAALCTSCEPGLFFSHRRDAGRTGRQAGLAWIPEKA